MRTHINLEGRELPCKAQPGNCRFEVVNKELPGYIEKEDTAKCQTGKIVNFVVKQKNDFMTKTSEGRLSTHITKDRWMRKKLLLDEKTSRVAVFSMEGDNGLEVHVLNDVGTLTIYRELKDRFTGKTLCHVKDLEETEQVDGVMITLMAVSKSRIMRLYEQAGETEEPSELVLENAELMRELALNEAIVHEQIKSGKTLPDKVKEIRLRLAETNDTIDNELARLKELRKEDKRKRKEASNKPEGAYYLLRRAEIHANKVTEDMHILKPKYCRLIKLDTIIKSEESLMERLKQPGCSINDIKDTLSYTLDADMAHIISVIKELKNNLNKEGYRVHYEDKAHLLDIELGKRKSLKLLVKVNGGYAFEVVIKVRANSTKSTKSKKTKPTKPRRGGTVGPNKLRIPKMRR